MNQIVTQVRSARRRIILAQFGRSACWTIFAAMLFAIVAIAVPALVAVEVDFRDWVISWIAGSLLLAILAAWGHALITAPTLQSVAAEVDHRFGLRERLSSSLSLDDHSRGTDFGMALLSDAEKRAEKITVAERFSLRPTRLGWLPASMLPIVAIVIFSVEPASESIAESRVQIDGAEIQQVKMAASELKKRIQQQRRKAAAEGLKDAKDLFEKIEADLDKITKRDNLDRKDAMIALNDLNKQLQERREQLGSPEQMRRVMAQMQGLESGPGEKVARSIEKGNFGEAKEVVKKLADNIRDGQLTDEEKQQLKNQVEQMAKQMQQAVEQHEQQKKDLQRSIEQARREGRGAEAAEMQQELNELRQKDSQMQQMQQMADAMCEATEAMSQGDASQTADALQQLSDQLGEMQQEMSELEDLQSAMDQLSQSKEQMRCQDCAGGGCQQCQGGGGFGDGKGGREPGYGSKQDQWMDDRPESETETNTYETQVRGQVKKGKAIIAGFADGPNRKGITQEDVKQSIQASLSEESDPTENQTLPRSEREHAQQYFDQLRDGR